MNAAKWPITALRIGLGWLLFYAGIIKILDPNWTAAGYLKNAKTFPGFFAKLASPENIDWVNFVNEWGLALLGFALLVNFWVKPASLLAAVLMFLYYLPVLDFPFIGGHGFIVDEHIVYILAFAVIYAVHAKERVDLRSFLKEGH